MKNLERHRKKKEEQRERRRKITPIRPQQHIVEGKPDLLGADLYLYRNSTIFNLSIIREQLFYLSKLILIKLTLTPPSQETSELRILNFN